MIEEKMTSIPIWKFRDVHVEGKIEKKEILFEKELLETKISVEKKYFPFATEFGTLCLEKNGYRAGLFKAYLMNAIFENEEIEPIKHLRITLMVVYKPELSKKFYLETGKSIGENLFILLMKAAEEEKINYFNFTSVLTPAGKKFVRRMQEKYKIPADLRDGTICPINEIINKADFSF